MSGSARGISPTVATPRSPRPRKKLAIIAMPTAMRGTGAFGRKRCKPNISTSKKIARSTVKIDAVGKC